MKTGKISKIRSSCCTRSYILYDDSIIAEPSLQLFSGDYHTNPQQQQNNSAAVANAGIGRAKVTRFSLNNRSLVLKHYYRGGAVARFVKDRYLGLNIENSRAFREWRLLKKMHDMALPVPRPVAAHVEKGLISYRADLITEEIQQATTLADVLTHGSISARQWHRVGACIKQFHRHDIYHADLNARNILLAGTVPDNADVYLIDFDRGQLRAAAKSWKMANLARLQRSLLKFKINTPGFNFTDNDWSNLLAGYKS
jgi:3-deoxy-D-manno-octulosonic acid kinase